MRTLLIAVGVLCVGLFAGFLLGRGQAVDFDFVLKCLPLLYVVVGVLIALQIRVSRTGRRTEDLFTLMEFLHRQEFRDARKAALVPGWDSCKDKDNAWVLCSSFDFAAFAVENGLVDAKLFLDYWAIPLKELGVALLPFLRSEKLGPNNMPGEEYWKHFRRLIDKANKHPEVPYPKQIGGQQKTQTFNHAAPNQSLQQTGPA